MALKINDHSAESGDNDEKYLDITIAKVDSYMAVGDKAAPENTPSSNYMGRISGEVMSEIVEEKTEKPIVDLKLSSHEPENTPLTTPDVMPTKTRHNLNKKQLTSIFAVVAITLIVGGFGFWHLLQSNKAELSETPLVNTYKIESYKIAPTFLEGSVEYSTDSKAWQPLTDKITLRQANTVRTGNDGRVILSIDDGSILRLDHDSAVKFSKLAMTDIQIQNLYGNVYNRVVESEKRKYMMLINDTSFQAMGTAFTINNGAEKKGVNVYQSKVKTANVEIGEGQSYYIEISDKSSIRTVQPFDIPAAKNDQFVKWNVEQDTKIKDFASKLGILAEPVTDLPEPEVSTPVGEIKITGTVSKYVLNVAWQVENLEASKGFKVVYSSKTALPVYGVNSSEYVSSPSARKATILPPDGRTYSIRVCAYDGKTCGVYSNAIKLTVPARPIETVSNEPTQSATKLSLSGTVLTWSVAGTAPNGYKVVASTSKTNPEYPADGYIVYVSNEETKTIDIASKLEPGVWNIRVCKYTGSGCTDYSNPVSYTKP